MFHHLHPKVVELANQFGVKLANRSCFDSNAFDGETIALAFTKGRWELNEDPAKDVHIQISSHYFSDHEVLHEIAHFVVAEPEQKDLPEYGLFNILPSTKPNPMVVDEEESNIQECMAQYLCIKWGTEYNITCRFFSEKFTESENWESYWNYKHSKEEVERFGNEKWTALVRLREKGLI
jgi:hypothetical protein